MSKPAVRRYSDAVEAALSAVCPSDDPFSRADFDAVTYLNERFNDEASLEGLRALHLDVTLKLQNTEADLLESVKTQATTATVAASDLSDAQRAVAGLQEKVREIRQTAIRSEERVRSIGLSIRQLDIAKCNLSEGIKTLQKLQLWVLQMQQLEQAVSKQNFRGCHDPLRSAHEHSRVFQEYSDVPKVKELLERLAEAEKTLDWQIRSVLLQDTTVDLELLREACLVADEMGPKCYKQLVRKYIDKELEVYRLKFKRGTEDARLERTERRYVYIRTLLDNDEPFFERVFPKHWCVPQEICLEFCMRTRAELSYLLMEGVGNVDVAALVYILQKTIEIEKELTARVRWREDFPGRDKLPEYRFNSYLVQCFEDHMALYIQQEREFMCATVKDVIDEVEWGAEGTAPRPGQTLPSSDDVFVFIKESLRRASSLSQKQTLLSVAEVWVEQLERYAKCLRTSLSSPPTSSEQERRACLVSNTADKCRATTEELAEALLAQGGRLEAIPGPAPDEGRVAAIKVRFGQAADSFGDVYREAILAVSAGVEWECSGPLQDLMTGRFMVKGGPAGSSEVEDKSAYVVAVRRLLHQHILNCSATLERASLKYLLDKVATRTMDAFAKGVMSQRRMPEGAPTRMRLDLKFLEQTLLQLPNVGNATRFAVNVLELYSRRVRQSSDRTDRVLKVLQLAVGPSLAEVYRETIVKDEQSVHHFAQLLEIQGVKGEDQRPLIHAARKLGIPDTAASDIARPAAEERRPRETEGVVIGTSTALAGFQRGVSKTIDVLKALKLQKD